MTVIYYRNFKCGRVVCNGRMTDMKIIDLRRDTITLPTEKMKKEALKAPLGDSVYDEDPKQCELEKLAAEKLGKEMAIFVPSGTMGNLVALLTHTERGNEIIVEENAHVRLSETGGAACVGGLMLKTVPGEDGCPDPAGVEHSIRPDNIHFPKTALICLENTHYRYGGIVPPVEKFHQIRVISERYGIPVHLDGARLFNASVYLDVPAARLAGFADSVMISLSKGLGAPVGSLLAGSSTFIRKAKRYRKMLGGGMRQTGWLCACGIVALSDENIGRLKDDHRNARFLAENLNILDGIKVDLERVHTNYVLAHIKYPGFSAAEFLKQLETQKVLANPAGEKTVRFVTSKEVTQHEILSAVKIIKDIISKRFG